MILCFNIWLFPENVVSLHSFMEIPSPPCLTDYNQDNIMNRIKILLATLLTTFLCVSQALADEIPAKFIGKWVTIMTDNVTGSGKWYLYAYENDGKQYLGQTMAAPNTTNYANYCWMIEGNASEGYTFRCLKYENGTKMYIANPSASSLTFNDKVLLAPVSNAGKYLYTSNRQFELKGISGTYIAMFSRSYREFRYYTSSNYEGSRMNFSAINDWYVKSVVINADETTSTLAAGGVTFGGSDYTDGSHFTGGFNPSYTQLPVSGYTSIGFEVDEDANIIISKYATTTSGITVKTAQAPTGSDNAVTGEDNTIWFLNPANYVTNSDNYTSGIPAGKAWQMEIVVSRPSDEKKFNQYGSTILASTADPFNAQYFNNFQIFQKVDGRLNFKSSIASGGDHLITQNHAITQNFKIIVRCNGKNVYVIRTILLNNDFSETTTSYDNLYVSARDQSEITQMSCALPTGIDIKSLKITIAEESDLIEGQSYAIYNKGTKQYLSWDYTADAANFRQMDGYLGISHASECQIEFVNDGNKVDYGEGLHTPFYLKTDVWAVASGQSQSDGHLETYFVGADNMVDANPDNKKKFIFVNNQIVPVIESGTSLTAGTPWSLGNSDQWAFDMFATFDVDVTTTGFTPSDPVANFGGMYYKNSQIKKGAQVKYPTSALTASYLYWPQNGYAGKVTKEATQLIVNYTPWDDYFNNLAVELNENTQGTNPDHKYYGTIYAPVALQLPAGVKAYKVTGTSTQGSVTVMNLAEIADGSNSSNNVLHSNTAAVLVKNDAPDATTTYQKASSEPAAVEGNLLSGVKDPTERNTSVSTYVLSGKSGVGFYNYTADVIPAFKAYYIPANSSDAKSFIFNFDDATGITEVTDNENISRNGFYYDLSGRQITTPVRGHIYIRNGTKVLYK